MSIAPIVQHVFVKVAPERAFRLFTSGIGRWWNPRMQIGARPYAEVVLEPGEGGRWFERDAEGVECIWGKVLAWEPPHRLLLAWQIDASFRYDPGLETEVEVRFEPEGDGTRVTLTHGRLERFGPSAERVAGQLAGGWPGLVQRFADLVEEEKDV